MLGFRKCFAHNSGVRALRPSSVGVRRSAAERPGEPSSTFQRARGMSTGGGAGPFSESMTWMRSTGLCKCKD